MGEHTVSMKEEPASLDSFVSIRVSCTCFQTKPRKWLATLKAKCKTNSTTTTRRRCEYIRLPIHTNILSASQVERKSVLRAKVFEGNKNHGLLLSIRPRPIVQIPRALISRRFELTEAEFLHDRAPSASGRSADMARGVLHVGLLLKWIDQRNFSFMTIHELPNL